MELNLFRRGCPCIIAAHYLTNQLGPVLAEFINDKIKLRRLPTYCWHTGAIAPILLPIDSEYDMIRGLVNKYTSTDISSLTDDALSLMYHAHHDRDFQLRPTNGANHVVITHIMAGVPCEIDKSQHQLVYELLESLNSPLAAQFMPQRDSPEWLGYWGTVRAVHDLRASNAYLVQFCAASIAMLTHDITNDYRDTILRLLHDLRARTPANKLRRFLQCLIVLLRTNAWYMCLDVVNEFDTVVAIQMSEMPGARPQLQCE
jgi:hypothetical protein